MKSSNGRVIPIPRLCSRRDRCSDGKGLGACWKVSLPLRSVRRPAADLRTAALCAFRPAPRRIFRRLKKDRVTMWLVSERDLSLKPKQKKQTNGGKEIGRASP